MSGNEKTPVERWIDEQGPLEDDTPASADAPLVALLTAARRSRPELSDGDAARTLELVLAKARVRGEHHRPSLARPLVGLAAVLALVAGNAAIRNRPVVVPDVREPLVLQSEVSFQSVENGKTVIFELKVYGPIP
jgi:hypothetical protein